MSIGYQGRLRVRQSCFWQYHVIRQCGSRSSSPRCITTPPAPQSTSNVAPRKQQLETRPAATLTCVTQACWRISSAHFPLVRLAKSGRPYRARDSGCPPRITISSKILQGLPFPSHARITDPLCNAWNAVAIVSTATPRHEAGLLAALLFPASYRDAAHDAERRSIYRARRSAFLLYLVAVDCIEHADCLS
jgi:hypothetical protein